MEGAYGPLVYPLPAVEEDLHRPCLPHPVADVVDPRGPTRQEGTENDPYTTVWWPTSTASLVRMPGASNICINT